jgi:hypothetical protein
VQPSVSSVIRLPETGEESSTLDSLRSKFSHLQKKPSLLEQVTLSCDLLRHESKLIRYLSIDELIRLCTNKRSHLFQSELNSSGTSSSSSLGLMILESLLLLSGRESDPNLRQIIARCLGQPLAFPLFKSFSALPYW